MPGFSVPTDSATAPGWPAEVTRCAGGAWFGTRQRLAAERQGPLNVFPQADFAREVGGVDVLGVGRE
ncbi:MAG: hypothetical protein BJ554DRAFT_1795 [Olpidium bornovanus]|uniref:Uncharacterized protein n=1 Tax=Olpidium bornovanus TaxID=278681 RepID=A0A8H8DH70_9FUNG|nr:MAG: hypothetical protein BJ554DRAFT_1795 [Olpidium bornovanus]